jgi:hypothetical protein
VRAIAFQIYANQRDAGTSQAGHDIHIAARRWFDKLMDILLHVRNAMSGLGFKTYQDFPGKPMVASLQNAIPR